MKRNKINYEYLYRSDLIHMIDERNIIEIPKNIYLSKQNCIRILNNPDDAKNIIEKLK